MGMIPSDAAIGTAVRPCFSNDLVVFFYVNLLNRFDIVRCFRAPVCIQEAEIALL